MRVPFRPAADPTLCCTKPTPPWPTF
jgi:hypothetical protein